MFSAQPFPHHKHFYSLFESQGGSFFLFFRPASFLSHHVPPCCAFTALIIPTTDYRAVVMGRFYCISLTMARRSTNVIMTLTHLGHVPTSFPSLYAAWFDNGWLNEARLTISGFYIFWQVPATVSTRLCLHKYHLGAGWACLPTTGREGNISVDDYFAKGRCIMSNLPTTGELFATNQVSPDTEQ